MLKTKLIEAIGKQNRGESRGRRSEEQGQEKQTVVRERERGKGAANESVVKHMLSMGSWTEDGCQRQKKGECPRPTVHG